MMFICRASITASLSKCPSCSLPAAYICIQYIIIRNGADGSGHV